MVLTDKYKKLVEYNNENGFIKISEDDVTHFERKYYKELQCASDWINAEKDGWLISVEHSGYGNLGNKDTEVTIHYQRKAKVDDLFGQKEFVFKEEEDTPRIKELKKRLGIE